MRIEVDQSGKIEQTDKDTVVAFSDDDASAILISAKVKRDVIVALRAKGKPKKPYHFIFAVAVYELLKRYLDRLDEIVIDSEYPGREPSIKGKLLELIRRQDVDFPADRITFGQIGKNSKAHERALATYQKEMKPDRVLTKRILMRHFEAQKKSSGKPFHSGL